MTIKEQERKALEQIKKIIESLGEDSYIGTAFEGCFEIAEENIENDWACSMKQRVEEAEKREQKLTKELCEMAEKLEDSDGIIKIQGQQIREKESMIEKLEEKIDNQMQELGEVKHQESINRETIESLENDIQAQETQIIKLKARLYDLLVK